METTLEEADASFSATTKNVALAGDVESNLRTVGGGLGAAGLGGVERGIGMAAEAPAVIEALPRLKESFKGMPATIDAASAALGMSSTAFMGIGIAIAAALVAFKIFTNGINKANDEIKRASELTEESTRVEYQGEEAARQRIAAAKEEIAVQQEVSDQNRKIAADHREYNEGRVDFFDYVYTDQEETALKLAKAAEKTIAYEQDMVDTLVEEFGPAILDTANITSDASNTMSENGVGGGKIN